MRVRYAGSKFRLFLLAAMLFSAGLLARTAYAQGAPAAAPTSPRVGLFSIILQNLDFIFVTIMLLSITGLTLIIQGFIKNRAAVFMPKDTTDQIRQMIQQRRFQELIDFTEDDPSFISKTLNPALKRAPSFSGMKEAMETAIGEQTAEQFRRIEYLNIIGNLGPLLGLLGTVYGMIEAFSAMQAEGGSASPATLAGGISKALAHTFLGLMLAIPCLAAFGVLRTMVDRLTVRGALLAEELLLMIKPAETRTASSSGERATPQPAQSPAIGRKPAISPQG
ncbi:MAG TPA: MotA/TolQ/ExbB proton channel family protein [Tepidisphaeraceae bacterium]|nr:MotA/TolQ/ExbB proton channel family protein [Tepidisphaeraceae bacterium]